MFVFPRQSDCTAGPDGVIGCSSVRRKGDVHLSTRNYFGMGRIAEAAAIPERRVPLQGHEDCAAGSVVDFRKHLAARLGAQRVWTESENEFEVRTSSYELPSGALWYIQNCAPLTLECADAPLIRVQIQQAGAGVTTINSQPVNICAVQGCISPAQATLDFGAGFRHVAWIVRTDVLIRKLVALTGSPVTRPLIFDPVFRRGTLESGAFLTILNSILANIEYARAAAPVLFIAELEHALMVSLLQTCRHTLSSLLESNVPAAGPWQVRQVEEYIATHWNAPFDIEQIASLTGMSARSIYRAFRRTRGYSPKAFARQRRLQQARLLLEEDPRDQNVTSVAFACGYTDASHFSREFSKAYGEAPSAILARNRRGN
jgi:AraC-like DNA-binding protein